MLIQSDLLDLLNKNQIVLHDIYNHPPLFTVEDSERLRGEIQGSHSKNLFLKNKKKKKISFSYYCSENAANVNIKASFLKVLSLKLIFKMKDTLMNIWELSPFLFQDLLHY